MRIGISGYDYPGWRGAFYPPGVPRRAWLTYAASRLDTVELNGTFYSLKTPQAFARWHAATPADFLFAVKGSRFITHNKKLEGVEGALANFLASGVLALEEKTGPLLWQLPATWGFRAERVERFLALLPRDTGEAAQLARGHDARLKGGALTEVKAVRPLRHAFEVRHPSWFHPDFYALLRRFGMALVLADAAGRFPQVEEHTAPFVYVRLHGSTELYASGYSDAELEGWAERVDTWAAQGRDVYLYFDNDARVHAPHDAQRLSARVKARLPGR